MLTIAFSKKIDSFHLNKLGQKNKIKKYDCIISLVRNPIDSISSIVSMELEFTGYHDDINKLIDKRITEYINFYSFVLNNQYIFIDFNDITKNIKEVIDYISKISECDILNNNSKDLVFNSPSENFLKTSKNSKNYNNVRSIVMNKNLGRCESLYNLLLNKCVKLNAI
jgi:hypothetical protein